MRVLALVGTFARRYLLQVTLSGAAMITIHYAMKTNTWTWLFAEQQVAQSHPLPLAQALRARGVNVLPDRGPTSRADLVKTHRLVHVEASVQAKTVLVQKEETASYFTECLPLCETGDPLVIRAVPKVVTAQFGDVVPIAHSVSLDIAPPTTASKWYNPAALTQTVVGSAAALANGAVGLILQQGIR